MVDKSDGDKGLYYNLVINAPSCWKICLTRLLEIMITHCHTADDILLSTIASLPKTPGLMYVLFIVL